MLTSHEKRQILVADDEMINREILGQMLKEDYEVLFASDGAETMEVIRKYQDTLSLVLLDILMPVMTGLDVLKQVKADENLSRIPIIVTTAERKTEVESLQQGAIDFIPKPYPDKDVIQARVRRTIELYEDRDLIQSTERDALTGLYNKEYFYRYAKQFDQYHKDLPMDAIIVDVNHFHMINERNGKAYGDEVLKRIGDQVQDMVEDSGGIVCRREADTFMIYCPSRRDYQEIMDQASIYLQAEDSAENRVRLRMGIYSDVDKEIDMERRFDRAKMAADTVKGIFTKTIAFYDNSLHQKQLYAEQLIEDFPAAIAGSQFQVFYQPKFDVRPDVPVLASAEALVRWIHPKLGMISPGVFIPLFEENGLIQKLDHYVWRETAAQI
ncbi:MAG: response regulator, partial [Eubacterium sp.]|nr:response regulator [Eubacterium sp.]